MRKFTYLTPKTLDEAISLHVSHGERAKYIAGGTDVLVKVKEGKLAPDYLISLKHIIGQDRPFLNQETGELYIGAFCTHGSIEESPLIQHHYPIIHDAVKNIGSVQIRNVATIGGNLVNAVPSADGAIPLIALDAKAHIYGTKGQRSAELRRFFLGPGQCDLDAGEILTEIVIPPPLPRTGSAYIKHGRREAMELPMLGVGVLLSLEKDMLTCAKARICLGVAAPTPFRALEAEKHLQGKTLHESNLAEAGRVAGQESKVRDSIRGVAWYRREMVGVLVKRMGLKAFERAKHARK
ncbi:MAG: FAD binding domain-containing protein [Desulfobacterales bacterium]|jgi:carbon-monoxide dehydrogenase medium subunit